MPEPLKSQLPSRCGHKWVYAVNGITYGGVCTREKGHIGNHSVEGGYVLGRSEPELPPSCACGEALSPGQTVCAVCPEPKLASDDDCQCVWFDAGMDGPAELHEMCENCIAKTDGIQQSQFETSDPATTAFLNRSESPLPTFHYTDEDMARNYEKGRDIERASIVEWLRNEADAAPATPRGQDVALILRYRATCIEEGQHHGD